MGGGARLGARICSTIRQRYPSRYSGDGIAPLFSAFAGLTRSRKSRAFFPSSSTVGLGRPLKMSTVIRSLMKCLLCRERACSMTSANTQDRASAYSVTGADTQDVLQDH